MHLTLFLLSALASSALGHDDSKEASLTTAPRPVPVPVHVPVGKKPVGFYILGANLNNLPHSMNQRIQHAVDVALGKHPHQEHIYFVSGWRGEAEYMKDFLIGYYKEKGLAEPHVEMDTKAMFTVMNFLKTIPMINKWAEKLEKVYMITSEYHMSRSRAILKEFYAKGLCKVDAAKWNFPIVPHGEADQDFADEYTTGHAKVINTDVYDEWLLTPLNRCNCPLGRSFIEKSKPVPANYYGSCLNKGNKCKGTGRVGESNKTRLDDIREIGRDQSNAMIFATLCRKAIDASHKELFTNCTVQWKVTAAMRRNRPLVEQYCKNNGAAPGSDKEGEKRRQMRAFCTEFVEAFET